MSISGALSNALTGLTAAARAAEVVSSNLSNAMTEGYGRREISLSSQNYRASGGVLVNGIIRHSNPVLVAERRLADAQFSHASSLKDVYLNLESLIGTPGQSLSLNARIADFEAALATAAGGADSLTRLKSVAQNASSLASMFRTTANGVQDIRQRADQSMGSMVERTNVLLTRIEQLNGEISKAINLGHDTSSLEDDRHAVVDELSQLVPVRQVSRDRGRIALYSTNGAILLDGSAVEFGFQETRMVQPHMSVENGLLSGLTINGNPVRVDAVSGGALGAQFVIRDTVAVQIQEELDAMARDLVTRFQSSSLDPTLVAGQAGLFTDSGSAFDPTEELGLANRLHLNSLVDPGETAEFWRLRDGLGASSPGDVGNASILNNMSDVMALASSRASGSFSDVSATFGGLADQVFSLVSANRVRSEEEVSFSASRLQGLETMELSDGVDSDHEMQKLILIERAYAANARIVEVVDEMMSKLLRL